MQSRRNNSRPFAVGIKPPKELRDAAVRLEQDMGSTGAARELGITRETLSRIIAGLGVRAGTISLAEKHLARITHTGRKVHTKASSAA